MTEETIFLLALEKRPDELRTFLDSACAGDTTLRHRVDVLLRAHRAPSDFLDEPAPLLAAYAGNSNLPHSASVTEDIGVEVGPYRLVQTLGEGGMGVVFRAEQTHPVKRTVALKVMKPGMDSRGIIARFEAERQALALMDHPNIAKVVDVGTIEVPGSQPTGFARPYFVMELVEGVPITNYCDDHSLAPRHRLELFIPVCHAVQHAHQKGIIHRDLKPSNVLVTQYDGKPVAKVIDFGIAKATGAKLSDSTLQTQVGALVGTLQYMSPEQANLSDVDIDTRSDIYSLGVVLYELLTGTPPIDSRRVKETPLLDVLRIIRDEEPERPSTRALQRHGPTAARMIQGELDWIAMKCLEKSRDRRYETANDLALDLQRYLRDEPVSACPPSGLYRIKKFVRRNRTAVLAAACVLVALVAGIVGTTVGLVRARFAEIQAKSDRNQAVTEKLRADDEAAIAQEVTDFLQSDVLRQADTEAQADRQQEPKPNLTVREALDRASARIGDRFRDKPLVEAAIRLAIGDAYRGVGEYQRSVEHLERSAALRKMLLGSAHAQTRKSMSSLAAAYFAAQRPKDALTLHKELMETWPSDQPIDEARKILNWGHLSRLFHDGHVEALDVQKEMIRLEQAALGEYHPEVFLSLQSLAIAYDLSGRTAECAATYEDVRKRMTITHGANHPQTLWCTTELAEALVKAGRLPEAIELLEYAVPRLRASRGPEHPHTLDGLVGLGDAYMEADRPTDAVPIYEEVVTNLKARFGSDHPWTVRSLEVLAAACLRASNTPRRSRYSEMCWPHIENNSAWSTRKPPSRLRTWRNACPRGKSTRRPSRYSAKPCPFSSDPKTTLGRRPARVFCWDRYASDRLATQRRSRYCCTH